MNNKGFKAYLIISIFLILIVGMGLSYSYFVYDRDLSDASLSAGKIDINFSNGDNFITVPNAYPVSDQIGKIYPYYADFSITGETSTKPIKYEIHLIPNDGTSLNGNYIKVFLTDQNDNVILNPTLYSNLTNAVNGGKIINSGTMTGNNGTVKSTVKNYRLRVWIDENYDLNQTKKFGFGIYLYAYNDDNN